MREGSKPAGPRLGLRGSARESPTGFTGRAINCATYKVRKHAVLAGAVQIIALRATMDIQYLSVYKVPGIVGLPNNADFELLHASAENGVRVFLTMARDSYYLHLRRLVAINQSIQKSFRAGVTQVSSSQTQFAELLAGIQIKEGISFDSPLLIVEATQKIENIDTSKVSPIGDIGLGLFDDNELAANAKPALECAISGLALALPTGEFREIESLGSATYFADPASNRTIYSLSSNFIQLSGSGSTSVTTETLASAANFATHLRTDKTLGTVSRLLSESSLARDRLTAFLTAWAGLEVFANKTFKDYEAVAFATLENASPPARKRFIERLKDMMKGKYNIRDRFVVIASELDIADADADIDTFQDIKKQRDAVHDMSAPPETLPTERLRDLLRKYLGLHLSRNT
jgi:hypothetical protein